MALSTLGWLLTGAALTLLFVLWLCCLFAVLVRSDLGGGLKAVWALGLIVLAPFAIVGALLFGRTRAAT